MRSLGGRYRLQRELGQGGMATVWQAHDEVLDRAVAVKLLTPEHTADPDAFDRARNEARCGARFTHPNVVSVYDFGTSKRSGRGTAYLVMELVEGQPLDEVIRSGPLDWRVAGRICAEVGAGLAAAHTHGIVHRDVKPANVVLTPSGAKILDFGVAARTGDPDSLPDGTLLGTPAYLAPERLDRGPATPAADVYALGVLLYQCLTGHLPFRADTDEQVLRAHRHTPPAPLPTIAGLPSELPEICTASLSKLPESRPTSVALALILSAAVDVPVHVPPILHPRPTPTATHTAATLAVG
ncbi:serine/threonine-protein kinase [Dactylosporangium sp. AC04546]|uniref:serine/threonine-protein kinase n=1 Tax=Dactylosporangium sp. AC04546 TaxID=2862460 RepID=UPI001EDFE6C0|nr:serine/threonine-protein kinase [Dactylosporangium sp. AC04546]WVK85976.1 serine/threonine-protein kinase [Dactylosporangium sp. AC04546]